MTKQIEQDKVVVESINDKEYQDEISLLKENLDRKEYLLQFNETKYH
jgi:hypothetical protein